MRLIDADALKRKAYYATVYDELSCIVDMEDIDEAPTIDPVKHGQWKVDIKGLSFFCSECEYVLWSEAGTEYNYCSRCGAKMDEEVRK